MYDFSGFSVRLRQVIKENNLTQIEVAKQLGISKHTFTNYLHGRVPETTILFALSRFFNKSMEWFLTGDHPDNSTDVLLNNKNQQYPPDFELQKMIDSLTYLMKNDDPDLKGWTKVQFKLAFGEYLEKLQKENQPTIKNGM